MRFLGVILIVVGLVSAGVYFLNMNFIFLTWINKWGATTGWIIRGGMVLLGLILYFLGKSSEEE